MYVPKLSVASDNERYQAACRYAAHGIPVFPVHSVTPDGKCTCRDPSCGAIGKHPVAGGSPTATTDTRRISAWWTEFPRANVAVRTGDGLVVIDVDNRPERGKDGVANFARLAASHGGVPTTVVVSTGGGGAHFYFRVDQFVANAQASDKLGAGVDIRGHNGYVVAPPSRHASGAQYGWQPGRGLGEIAIAKAPTWLIERIVAGPRAASEQATATVATTTATRHGGASIPRGVGVGSRHNFLVRIAGMVRARGLDVAEVHAVLREVNARRCTPPQARADIESIARDIGRRQLLSHVTIPERIEARQRMVVLPSLARSLWMRGFDEFETATAVAEVNARRCTSPLSIDEIVELVVMSARSVMEVR